MPNTSRLSRVTETDSSPGVRSDPAPDDNSTHLIESSDVELHHSSWNTVEGGPLSSGSGSVVVDAEQYTKETTLVPRQPTLVACREQTVYASRSVDEETVVGTSGDLLVSFVSGAKPC